jgi:hypothetical protein
MSHGALVWFFIFDVPKVLVMKINQKVLLLSFLSFAFMLITKHSFAQFPGMGAVRAQQNAQFIGQQMQTHMQVQMMQVLNMHGVTSTQKEYNFIVTLRDSTTLTLNSAIYIDSVSKKRFIVLVDKQYKKSDSNRYKKIYPSQTRGLVCVVKPKNAEFDQPGFYLPGKLTDSCWMFKAITGEITAYSDVCEEDGVNFDRSTIVGIQLKDGPIVKYNEDNLKQMVGQDINALEAIQNKNYYKAIKKYNRDQEKEAKK